MRRSPQFCIAFRADISLSKSTGTRVERAHSLRPVVPDCVTVQQCQMPHFPDQSHARHTSGDGRASTHTLFPHTNFLTACLQLTTVLLGWCSQFSHQVSTPQPCLHLFSPRASATFLTSTMDRVLHRTTRAALASCFSLRPPPETTAPWPSIGPTRPGRRLFLHQRQRRSNRHWHQAP